MQCGFVLFALLLGAAAASAAAPVPAAPASVTPLNVGVAAPAFSALEVDGRSFSFRPDRLRGPVLLIFYRGGWCPYCNAHLKDLRTVEPQIVKMGYQILFLSTDKPALLYDSLKEKVGYHILSDASMEAARAFGVAYRVDDATLANLKTYGIDLEATQGTSAHELPVPSVFIVDRSGIIRFRHFDPDYRVRLPAGKVLAAARDSLSRDE